MVHRRPKIWSIKVTEVKKRYKINTEYSSLSGPVKKQYFWNPKNTKSEGDPSLLLQKEINNGYILSELKNNYIGPIFIDTKKPDLKRFQNCIIKINDTEYQNRTSSASGMIVTYGGDMVTYKDKIFTPPNVEAFDACGCGDTFLAALVYHYLKTNHTPESIIFAMKAAAVTVKHLGVYAPTLEEIKNDSN